MRGFSSSRRRSLGTRVGSFMGALLVVTIASIGLGLPRISEHAHRQLRSEAEADLNNGCAPLAPWEEQGGVVVYIALLCYTFVALAIVCDDYFVASLEKITDALRLSQDVAGATFMAAGSSAPELFVSLADNVFVKPQESLGIGTIVGSAIFNILIIIALSALLAGRVLCLDWRPLLRDSLWYCASICLLTYAIWDGQVDLYEAVALFGTYVVYILYMSQNERIVQRFCQRSTENDEGDAHDETKAAPDGDASVAGRTTSSGLDTLSLDDENAAERAAQLVGGARKKGTQRPWTIDVERVKKPSEDKTTLVRKHSDSTLHQRRENDGGRRDSIFADLNRVRFNPIHLSKYRMFQYHPHLHQATTTAMQPLSHGFIGALDGAQAAEHVSSPRLPAADEPESGYFDEVFDVPSGILGKLWFLFTRPIVIAFRLTVPDCRFPQFAGPVGYTSTFVLSIAWIAVLSHFTVLFATRFGCIARIPSALMGLTIIAAGTSIPDALSSILVARDGHGDMAVSNAIGSNVFDILLGLGLPFFLSNLVYKEPVVVNGDDLELSIFILFGVLIAVVLILIVSRWRLHPVVGGALAFLYAGYVVFSYLHGLGQV